ncbi:MAG: membrane protein insertase YidC [Firmicutes bacterium]|jgi:YidC/Oxa1 family membrane protein insertase|nr:membrane protein insertase YidC [Bacillota bacterium]
MQVLTEYVNIVLTFFYNITGNYGLAIILLTALVNIITFPLTRKQIQSSRKLQEIQPELKRIQEKYKHDKEKYNQATMEYMRDKKINPLGGCLPLIIQFPIIIAVFTLLREPDLIQNSIENFNPYFLGLNLMNSPNDVKEIYGFLNPYYILPVLAAAATFFHQKLVLTDPKQKMMLYIFPVMILVISVGFPSGLVLYWLTNSIFSVGNHFLMPGTEKKKKVVFNKNNEQERISNNDVQKKDNISKGEKKEKESKVKVQTGSPKNKKKKPKKKKKGAK